MANWKDVHLHVFSDVLCFIVCKENHFIYLNKLLDIPQIIQFWNEYVNV